MNFTYFPKLIFFGRFWPFFILGVNLSLGQMPFDLPFISVLTFVILGWLWQKYKPSPGRAAIWGFGLGLGYFAPTLSWIIHPFMIKPGETGWIAPFAFVTLVVILAFLFLSAFYLASSFGSQVGSFKRLILLWVFLTFTEIIRSSFLLSFPWPLISAIWINTPISQSLSIFGPYWLSSITIFAGLIISRPIGGTIFGIVIFAILFGFGYSRLSEPAEQEAEVVTLKIIQPNIRQAEKWLPEKQLEFFTRQINLSKKMPEADIVIWPETAVAFSIENNTIFVKRIVDSGKLNVILGARRFEKDNYSLFNSAYFLSAKGDVVAIYDKNRLVPFGEYVPFAKLFSKLGIFGLASNGITGFTEGKTKKTIALKNLPPVLTLICYEAIFTSDVDSGNNSAKWILQLTNDAWFGTFNGPQQHLALARMRAIEQGIPLIRAANTGISAIIDSYGRLVSKLPMNRSGVLDGNLPEAKSDTIYSHFGAVFLNIILVFLLLLTICWVIIMSRRS